MLLLLQAEDVDEGGGREEGEGGGKFPHTQTQMWDEGERGGRIAHYKSHNKPLHEFSN